MTEVKLLFAMKIKPKMRENSKVQVYSVHLLALYIFANMFHFCLIL